MLGRNDQLEYLVNGGMAEGNGTEEGSNKQEMGSRSRGVVKVERHFEAK